MATSFTIAPELSLALALRGTPGAYAVLLGSGVSRGAGVPTGWEVVLDLTRRVAAGEGTAEAAGADPVAWYRERFDAEPSYTKLLEMLAPSPAERRELLRPYFEPSEEDRAEARKIPTRAHRAVAQLVAKGYIRVILTTNFDRLMETALQDVGVPAAVISSADAAEGALPLQHERVTVIKLHGDYLDTRIKNTPEELASYAPAMDRLLDRVLDEYGLVVCGWSASWDDALLRAFERSPARRFTTYWAQRGPLSTEAQRLIDLRRAHLVTVNGADAFFGAVVEKVEALEEVDRPHPISKAVAIASLKRYLPAEESRIRLHDLVMAEVETVRARTATLLSNASGTQWADIAAAVLKLDGASDTLLELLAVGAYWSEARHMSLWRKALERLATVRVNSPYTAWINLGRYPAQLAFYAVGIALTELRAEDLLASWLKDPKTPSSPGEDNAPVMTLHLHAVVEHDAAKWIPDMKERQRPMSEHLHAVLRPAFTEVVPDDAAFDAAFDRFEYLITLAYVGRRISLAGNGDFVRPWGPIGRFAWRSMYGSNVMQSVEVELAEQGVNWFLLRHGFFKGSLEELTAMKAKVDERIAQVAF